MQKRNSHRAHISNSKSGGKTMGSRSKCRIKHHTSFDRIILAAVVLGVILQSFCISQAAVITVINNSELVNGNTTSPAALMADPHQLLSAIDRGLAIYGHRRRWLAVVKRGMNVDFSWTNSARQYLELYNSLITEAEL